MAKTIKITVKDFEPNAWERFERAVDVVANSPPQPRKKTKSRKGGSPKAKAKRSEKGR